MTTAELAAYTMAVRTSPKEAAAYLQRLLGQKLVALMTGVRDPKAVGRWANGAHVPTGNHEERLQHAFQIAWMLTQEEPQTIVRAWFIGMNPQLNDVSPAEALRDGKHAAVLAAATAFLAGG